MLVSDGMWTCVKARPSHPRFSSEKEKQRKGRRYKGLLCVCVLVLKIWGWSEWAKCVTRV